MHWQKKELVNNIHKYFMNLFMYTERQRSPLPLSILHQGYKIITRGFSLITYVYVNIIYVEIINKKSIVTIT